MKILALNSSPNKDGSTAKLVEMFLLECTNLGAECERVDLIDFLISEDNSKEISHRIDGLIQLNAKIINSDGILIASPFFYGNISKELDLFIKHIEKTAHKRVYIDKYFVGASISLQNNCDNIAKKCSTLDGLTKYSNGQSIGYIGIKRMNSIGIIEVNDDNYVYSEIKKLSNNLISNIRSRRISNLYRIKKIIFRSYFNFVLIKFRVILKKIKSIICKFLIKIKIIKSFNDMNKYF